MNGERTESQREKEKRDTRGLEEEVKMTVTKIFRRREKNK
jgi:hypothetical protein